MERIKVAGWEGIAELASDGDEPAMVGLILRDTGGRIVSIEIGADDAISVVPGLISALSTLAAAEKHFQMLMPVGAWKVELAPDPPHQPMLDAFLPGTEGARLSFAIQPEHLRPLAQLLERKADELEAKGKAPLAPGSSARN